MNVPQIRQEDIAARAYELWEKEGSPQGRDLEHWHQASRELAEAGAASAPTESVPSVSQKKSAEGATSTANRVSPAAPTTTETNGIKRNDSSAPKRTNAEQAIIGALSNRSAPPRSGSGRGSR